MSLNASPSRTSVAPDNSTPCRLCTRPHPRPLPRRLSTLMLTARNRNPLQRRLIRSRPSSGACTSSSSRPRPVSSGRAKAGLAEEALWALRALSPPRPSRVVWARRHRCSVSERKPALSSVPAMPIPMAMAMAMPRPHFPPATAMAMAVATSSRPTEVVSESPRARWFNGPHPPRLSLPTRPVSRSRNHKRTRIRPSPLNVPVRPARPRR